MDINTLRELATVISFATFIGIVLWAYGSRQKGRFDDAARIPFDDPPALPVPPALAVPPAASPIDDHHDRLDGRARGDAR